MLVASRASAMISKPTGQVCEGDRPQEITEPDQQKGYRYLAFLLLSEQGDDADEAKRLVTLIEEAVLLHGRDEDRVPLP